jgi:excisionase family DNA binding protein
MQTNAKRRDSLMRVKEVAHELGQHPATIYRKVHDGSLPAVRLGPGRAAIRIDSAELERWLYAIPSGPPDDPGRFAPERPGAPGEAP